MKASLPGLRGPLKILVVALYDSTIRLNLPYNFATLAVRLPAAAGFFTVQEKGLGEI
jgi:hypothetical protein